MNPHPSTRAYGAATPTRRFDAHSSDGTRLAVQEWGRAEGPVIVFIHAWSQSHLGWAPQLQGELGREFRLISFDHRGHGESDKPGSLGAYTEQQLWADDVAAVLQAAAVERAVLVPWSLGGVVALDYLQRHGATRVAGINFVAAGNAIGNQRAMSHFGAAVAEHAQGALASDLRVQLNALLRLQQALVLRDLHIEDFSELVTQAIVASPLARAGLLSRQVDHEATLRGLSLPMLLSHGSHDAILTLEAARDVMRFAPQARLSMYEGAGHAPHFEDPARFDRELAAFVRELN
jgi:pimeloyl-ACP methyl ester carboxylesterase